MIDIDDDHGELFRLTFATGLAEDCNIGFFAQERASQTEVSELLTINELTDEVRKLTEECNEMKRDLSITKGVLASEFTKRLQDKSLELYSRMNSQVADLERMQAERVDVVRRAFKTQLTDALIKVRNMYDSDFESRMNKARSRQDQNANAKDAKIKELQDLLQKKEAMLQILQMKMSEMMDQVPDDTQVEEVPRILTPESPKFSRFDIEEKDKEIEGLKKKLARLEDQIANQKSQSGAMEAERAELTAELASQRSLVDQLTAEREEMRRRLEDVESAAREAAEKNEAAWKKEVEDRAKSARDKAMSELKAQMEKLQAEERTRYQRLLDDKEIMEKKFAEEREGYLAKLEKLKDVDTLKKREAALNAQVNRLKTELARVQKVWEKKFSVLRQSLHALKDESYLRQSLQRQAAQLHQASVMYASDMPVGMMPPGASRGGQQDQFSYTVSAPRTSQSGGIGYFSEDEDQVVSSEGEDVVLPPGVRPLPSPPPHVLMNQA